MAERLNPLFPILIILIVGLIPWVTQQIDIRVPGDAAFLFTGAEYILDGHAMRDYYYDTNPPMSFLIYTPAVLLQSLGLDEHSSIYVFTFALIGVSLLLFAYCLSFFKIDDMHKAALLSAYLASITLFSYNEFGQKDHFIAIILPVFLLVQLSGMLEDRPQNAFLFLIFLALTPFILIKPHYGLLPVCAILYRAWSKKNLTSIFGFDFLALSIGVIVYIASIYAYFPEYISEIFPVSKDLYFSGESFLDDTGKKALAIAAIALCMCAIAGFNKTQPEQDKLNIYLGTMAMLTFIPFWVQNKGFSVHLLPTMSLLVPAIFVNAVTVVPKTKFQKFFKPHNIALAIIGIFYLAFILGPQTNKKPEFEDSSLARLIRDKAGDRPYIFESLSTNIFYSQSLYIENDIGMRFPSLWFLARLHSIENEQKRTETTTMFAEYFAQDLEKFKPVLIGLVQAQDGKSNAVLYYFKDNSAFDTAWSKYRKAGEYKLSPLEFSDFLLRKDAKDEFYDLYERIE